MYAHTHTGIPQPEAASPLSGLVMLTGISNTHKQTYTLSHTHACTHAHTHMHACMYTRTHTHTCMHTHTRACMHVHTHTHTRMHAHTHLHTTLHPPTHTEALHYRKHPHHCHSAFHFRLRQGPLMIWWSLPSTPGHLLLLLLPLG